ncbi:hypothetical protein BJ912DRAFT_1147088 [Pholiota molesta]|nr:hypothetical protein BJ912DRAFT_1147088 [Pholiota molesta]
MVSTRTPKTVKASYAERVMGAFSQLQREHKKHAVHPAALRAQVKKDAEAKKDKLGRNWSHWVGRALSKMEEEGLFEPVTPNGSLALTTKGKKAVNYARRSVRKSIGASPGRNEDGLLWKEVTSYSAAKRPRRSSIHNQEMSDDSDDGYYTPSKSMSSPKKRTRFSAQLSGKKPIAKMTKAELRAELDSLKKDQSQALRMRSLSPLTDLDSEDEGITTQLRDNLGERGEGVDDTRHNNNVRFTTPETNIRTTFDHSSPPMQESSPFLSPRLSVTVHPESGPIIPNPNRQPTLTPAISIDHSERRLRSENTPVIPMRSQAAATAMLEKAISDRVKDLEQAVTERDETIDALRKDSAAYKTEVAALQDSWKRAEDMVTTTLERLTISEALVGELRAEKESDALKVKTLQDAKDDLVRSQETLQVDLERANARYSAANTANESLQTETSNIANELATLKEEVRQANVKISELKGSLSEASGNEQVLQRRNVELEHSIARYEAEVAEKQRNCQQLEARISVAELAHEQTLSRLSETERFATETSAQLTISDVNIASLTNDLMRIREEQETLRRSLSAAHQDLHSEEAKSRELEAQLSDKDKALHVSQQDLAEARLTIQSFQTEITEKECIIIRLSNEKDGVQESLSKADARITDLQNAQEAERTDSSRKISEFEASLSSAKADIAANEIQMNEIREEKVRLKSDLNQRVLLVEDLQARLDIERKEKFTLETELLATAAKIQDLEEKLRNFRKCKTTDDQTILTLREYFVHLRESQAKLFGDVEAKIDATLPSTSPLSAPESGSSI